MRIALIFLVLALTGCASVATDYQTGTRFAKYDTWAYSKPEQGAVSLDAQRVKQAVEKYISSLTSLEQAPEDEADLLVRGRVVSISHLERTGFSFGLGTSHDHLGFGLVTAPPVRKVEEGKVVVEMVARESRQVVWQAESLRNLTPGMSPEARSEMISKLVKDMFEKYPPGEK